MEQFKLMASEFEEVKGMIENLEHKINVQTCQTQVFEPLTKIIYINEEIMKYIEYIDNPTLNHKSIEDRLNSMEEILALEGYIKLLLSNLNGNNLGAEPCLEALYDYTQ